MIDNRLFICVDFHKLVYYFTSFRAALKLLRPACITSDLVQSAANRHTIVAFVSGTDD